eukprot:scaffold262481_cov18-Tisochrysis_lutea.AAC.1
MAAAFPWWQVQKPHALLNMRQPQHGCSFRNHMRCSTCGSLNMAAASKATCAAQYVAASARRQPQKPQPG